MRKFYINEFKAPWITTGVPSGQMTIGLFKQCETDARGHAMGWYAEELYINTTLYAYYIADGKKYDPAARLSKVKLCRIPIRYKEVHIGSDYWTMVIEAETVKEAIELFKIGKWRDWSSKDKIIDQHTIAKAKKLIARADQKRKNRERRRARKHRRGT